MCGQFDQIDIKIKRLQVIARRILDQQTLDGIAELIAELEAKKPRVTLNRSVKYCEPFQGTFHGAEAWFIRKGLP
jgi:hypothetical protein